MPSPSFGGIKPTGPSRQGENCPAHSDCRLNRKRLCLPGDPCPRAFGWPSAIPFFFFFTKLGMTDRPCFSLKRPKSIQLPFGMPLLKPIQTPSPQPCFWPARAAVGSEQSLFFIGSIPSPPQMSYLFNVPDGAKHTWLCLCWSCVPKKLQLGISPSVLSRLTCPVSYSHPRLYLTKASENWHLCLINPVTHSLAKLSDKSSHNKNQYTNTDLKIGTRALFYALLAASLFLLTETASYPCSPFLIYMCVHIQIHI